MKKKNHFFKRWLEYQLRRICKLIPIQKRLSVVLSLCLILGAISIYVLVDAVCGIGKKETEKLQAEQPINELVNPKRFLPDQIIKPYT